MAPSISAKNGSPVDGRTFTKGMDSPVNESRMKKVCAEEFNAIKRKRSAAINFMGQYYGFFGFWPKALIQCLLDSNIQKDCPFQVNE